MKDTKDAKMINKHGTTVYVQGHRVADLLETGNFKMAGKDGKASKKSKKEPETPVSDEVKQLMTMKKDDLLSLALDSDIEVSKEMKKDEIINAIVKATA